MVVAPKEPEHGHVAYPGSVAVAYVVIGLIAVRSLLRAELSVEVVVAWIPSHLVQFVGLLLLPRFYAISLTQTYYFLRGEPVLSFWLSANRLLSERALFYFAGLLYLGFALGVSWGLLGFLFSWGNTP